MSVFVPALERTYTKAGAVAPARVPRAALAMWGLVMIASVASAAGAGAFLVAAPGLCSWRSDRARGVARLPPAGRMHA